MLISISSYFAQAPVLAALSADAKRRLERNAEQRQYRRRQVVHFPDQPGDFAYLLCTGRIKISRMSEQGREITLHLIDAPQLFGETGIVPEGGAYGLMAETLEDSMVAVFRRADLLQGILESPDATIELLKLVGQRRAAAESQVADLVFLEVPKRLAKLLLRLSDHAGKSSRGSGLARTKFTHQELANMIGSTRETTTLILNDFKRQGALDFAGRRIVIRDPSILEAILRRNSDALARQ